ncbi:hypothetical protein B0H16DRAFT_1476125 [Mycena metata]|uniref:Uncharacterized protein n=1 Tax=Mycena metata TaxID=1033252 RepID=A0AAD7MH68_9AGAR|nr:hypothetical protein B0H16DRAFT_1476125 [Mycena metata]
MPLDALTLGEVQQLQYFSVVYLQEGIDRLNPGKNDWKLPASGGHRQFWSDEITFARLGRALMATNLAVEHWLSKQSSFENGRLLRAWVSVMTKWSHFMHRHFPLPEQVLIMKECRGSWGQYTGIKIEKLQTNVKGTIVHAFKPNSTQFSPSALTLTYRLVVGQGTGTEPAGPKSRSRNLRTDLGNGSEALKGLQDKEPGDIITVSKARMRSGNKIQDIRQNCKSSLSAAPANLGNGSRRRWVMGQSKVEGYWPSESPRLSLRSEFSQHARVTWSKELEVQDTE